MHHFVMHSPQASLLRSLQLALCSLLLPTTVATALLSQPPLLNEIFRS